MAAETLFLRDVLRPHCATVTALLTLAGLSAEAAREATGYVFDFPELMDGHERTALGFASAALEWAAAKNEGEASDATIPAGERRAAQIAQPRFERAVVQLAAACRIAGVA